MRTIKFRAIKDDMSDCRFVYGSLIYDHKGNPRIQEDTNEPTFTTCIKGSECQFTGLHDKTGKEIYEGDLLKEITNPCAPNFKAQFNELNEFWEVKWDERECGFNSFPIASKKIDLDKAVEQLGGEILWPSKDVLANHWHYEIIGNVFENADLVKLQTTLKGTKY